MADIENIDPEVGVVEEEPETNPEADPEAGSRPVSSKSIKSVKKDQNEVRHS
jgi:hypothetical protein